MPSIRLVTEVPGPRSRELAARREAATARGSAKLTDLAIERAQGPVVVDADGNHLLDFAGGIGTLAVGHRPENVVAALQEQLERLIHFCAIVGTYEPYVELAEKLCRVAPIEGERKAVLLNSGAEAVETAVKIARAHTGRQAIVVFEGAYHGRTNLTLAMTSRYGAFKKGFGPFAPEIYRLPFPYPFRRPAGVSEEAHLAETLAALDRALITQVDPSAIAAIVFEPVQGEAGFVPIAEPFIRRIREICDEHGIVMIADEIQSGMGRTGKLFAVEHFGITPDLVTVAKSLGAGMPISAVVGKARIMDAPSPGGLGGTYSGNPLACAAAGAALDTISSPAFLQRAQELGVRMRGRLEALAERFPNIGEVRGLGPMLALELVQEDGMTPAPELVQAITREALARGLIVIRSGLYGQCIRLLPPLDLSDEVLDEAMDVLAGAVGAVLQPESRALAS